MKAKCPKCGFDAVAFTNWSTGSPTYDFTCGTEQLPGGLVRGEQCYENEITNLKSLLTRCQKFFDSMRYVDKYHALYGEDDSVEQIETDIKAILEEEGK